MKKTILTAAALIAITSTASAADFQKVYEVPGMSATEIKQAYGDPTIDIGMDNLSKFQDIMNTAQGTGWLTGLNEAKTGKLRCDIAVSSWLPSVNQWADADVVLQVKDGRARVTVDNLKLYGPGKETCVKSIETYLDKKFATLKKLDNNW